ncbi:S ribonuclease [Pyrus ussuriensis x Pyrus communis]|uniref:S ribonuclease n=1 Tax=Pyrus ussuriensis x Pyrus communis TaxID=2448454 RepID=A0A5N5HZN9_9ROSA|nr:S ribonuclease [Pyrus ussuriensis x Pyrus communis]
MECCSTDWRWKDLELLEEKRAEDAREVAVYHQQVAKTYNHTARPCNFKEEDLVLGTTDIRRQITRSLKFAPHRARWFMIKEAYRSGYYYLTLVKEGKLTEAVNAKWLKSYYW